MKHNFGRYQSTRFQGEMEYLNPNSLPRYADDGITTSCISPKVGLHPATPPTTNIPSAQFFDILEEGTCNWVVQ